MIRGIGIDVVQVSRMRAWIDQPYLLRRFFHSSKVAAVMNRGDASVLALSARFAAKEAYGKALGTGLRNLSLRDVYVSNDELGKPALQLEGSARAALERIGGSRVFISLTHEQDNAIAMIVIEGDD